MLSNQVFRILSLFMHLLCTILGHDITKNHSIPRVCYRADGVWRNAGPRPFSPPHPRLGVGSLFRYSLPLSPLRPHPGNECGWAPNGGRGRIRPKTLPAALFKGVVWRVKTYLDLPRHTHYLYPYIFMYIIWDLLGWISGCNMFVHMFLTLFSLYFSGLYGRALFYKSGATAHLARKN